MSAYVPVVVRAETKDSVEPPVQVDLDSLTPKARALAEAITLNWCHKPADVKVTNGRQQGDSPTFHSWGDNPERAAELQTTYANFALIPSESSTTPEWWLENAAHGLGPDVYPIAGRKTSLEPYEEVPSAEAASTDRCLRRTDARLRIERKHRQRMSPNLWQRLESAGHLPQPFHRAAGGTLLLWHVDDIDAYAQRDFVRWTTTEVAEHLGYRGPSATGTARKQLSRWEVRPVGRQPGRDGEDEYAADQIMALHAARPGRGRHAASRARAEQEEPPF